MKKIILLICFSVFLLLSRNVEAVVKTATKEIPYLFVTSSQDGYIKGDKLFLNNVNPNTVYFADKPSRIAGHIDSKKFLSTWNNSQNTLNTIVSFKNRDGYVDMTIEISNPQIKGRDVTFTINNILESSIELESNKKIKFSYPNLFIDGNGCWLFGC